MTEDIDPAIATAIGRVLDYMWDDEQRDCEERYAEGNDPGDHIFSSLVALKNYLHGTAYTTIDLIDVEDDE
jgi:hypothetical protein